MRYSRLKRQKGQKRYITGVMALLLIFGGLYIASTAAAGNFISKLLSPVLNSIGGIQDELNPSDTADNSEDLDLTVPSDFTDGEQQNNDNLTTKITEKVKIMPLTMSAIQIGAFSNKENADISASELQSKGGAGYIIDDNFFRVIAMGFLDSADASIVKTQLEQEGIECRLYNISYPGADMQITASEKNVEEIKQNFLFWYNQYNEIEEVIKDLDKDVISVEAAFNRISKIREGLEQHYEKLKLLSATQESSHILKGLLELYQSEVSIFDGIIKETSINKVVISSKLKYTYIDMVYKYKKYMDSIIGG